MSITVTNLESGETLGYSLPMVVGEVRPPLAQGTIKVSNKQTGRTLLWPIFNGQFKALVELAHGSNHLQFKYYGEVLEFVLVFRVPNIKRFVRPVYIRPHDEGGTFQAPDGEDCSCESAVRRISLASKLIQTFTAEKMHEHKLGRRTFVLENDLYPKRPKCHVFPAALSFAESQTMDGGDLWMTFARELMSTDKFVDKDYCKWYTFMSFTRYCPSPDEIPRSHSEVIRHTKGHAALGGGGLALFGTGNLHTWAERLEEVVTRFTDTRKINMAKFMDDSAYRHFHWANYSTGLGASLHELGHTFDLAHTPTGIMSRGFDDIYKFFVVHPPISRVGSACTSRDSSRLASPIPYSPKQSPVHRPRPRKDSGASLKDRNGSSTPNRENSPARSGRVTPQSGRATPRQEGSPRARRERSPSNNKAGSQGPNGSSRSSSPKACPSLRPTHSRSSSVTLTTTSIAMVPTVIQIETAFKRLDTSSAQTYVVQNYDGSETKRTITKHKDGTETVAEVTSYPNGEQVAKETVRHIATGKTRTTMSMNSASLDSDSMAPSGSGTPNVRSPEEVVAAATPAVKKPNEGGGIGDGGSNGGIGPGGDPSRLPKGSPDDGLSSSLNFQEIQYKDGGAHWYRASAVLLKYHKWFNPESEKDTYKIPELQGNVIKSTHGIRLVELRSLPDGVVFHHWEFPHDKPRLQFQLKYGEIKELSRDAETITVLAEDHFGNILKVKLKLEAIQDEDV